MKKLIISLVILLCAVSSYSIDMKKYQIKSGIVEYKITGKQQGTQTLYFDNWGLLSSEYQEATTSMMGMTVKSYTLNITDKEWTYNINLDEKTGTKVSNKDIKDLMNSLDKKDMDELGRKMMERLGGKKIGNETFLGKNCEVWELTKLKSKVWVYKYIPLKTIMNIIGEVTIEAVKIEDNASVAADKFVVPKGIKITEQKITEEEKQMSEEMMKMFGNGEIDLEKMQKMIEKSNQATEEEEENEGKK